VIYQYPVIQIVTKIESGLGGNREEIYMGLYSEYFKS
jgi:hypothetical protein